MYIEDFEAFYQQAVELYRARPLETRYCIKYRHSEGKLVIKVTDDKQVCAHRTAAKPGIRPALTHTADHCHADCSWSSRPCELQQLLHAFFLRPGAPARGIWPIPLPMLMLYAVPQVQNRPANRLETVRTHYRHLLPAHGDGGPSKR